MHIANFNNIDNRLVKNVHILQIVNCLIKSLIIFFFVCFLFFCMSSITVTNVHTEDYYIYMHILHACMIPQIKDISN